MLVFDQAGRVLAVNAAFERLIGRTHQEIVGLSWTELCPTGEEAERAIAWLTSGVEGVGRRIEIPANTGSGTAVTLVMTVTRLGAGEQSATVGNVVAAREREPLALPHVKNDEYYEISSHPDDLGKVSYVWATGRASADSVGKLCYASFYDRSEPCVNCPAFKAGRPGEVRTGVVRFGTDGESFGLVTSEFTEQRIRVSVRRISREEVSELVRARIDLLAEDGGLSNRERSVLALLIEGKSADDIGEELGISPRTAKFHQTNILQKLGVDSRLDLFRLVVE